MTSEPTTDTNDTALATYEQCINILKLHPPYIGLTFALACRSGDRLGMQKTRVLCMDALDHVADQAVAGTIRRGIRQALLWADDGRRARCIEKVSLDMLPIEERAAYYGRVSAVQDAMRAGMSGPDAARSIG